VKLRFRKRYKQEHDDFAVTDEHIRESSPQPTRETAHGWGIPCRARVRLGQPPQEF
jgi:hypothetical protein